MEFCLLEHRLKRLVQRLQKHNRALEIFEHNDIVYGEIIGRGGEGVVQRCTIHYNGLPVDAAVKILNDNSDDAIGITLDEIEMLCLGLDPIIQTTLQVYGVAAIPDENSDHGHLVIITEAGLMNALQLYQDYDVPLNVTFDLWSRMAAAIYSLHTKKILHQDIKPENILIMGIDRDRSGQIQKVDAKIIDLGMGKRLFTTTVITDEILGTVGYHPPEVLLEDAYDFRADVFMLGVTYCVLHLNSDFLKKQLNSLLKKLHDAKKKGMVGRSLYNIICKSMDDTDLPTKVRNMIITMLEHQDKRTIPLPEVVEICRTEARRAREEQSRLPPVLSPVAPYPLSPVVVLSRTPMRHKSTDKDTEQPQDSGFSSILDCKSNANKRARRSCTFSDSGMSNDVNSNGTDTNSKEPIKRKRRNRNASECAPDEVFELPSPAIKRQRRHTGASDRAAKEQPVTTPAKFRSRANTMPAAAPAINRKRRHTGASDREAKTPAKTPSKKQAKTPAKISRSKSLPGSAHQNGSASEDMYSRVKKSPRAQRL